MRISLICWELWLWTLCFNDLLLPCTSLNCIICIYLLSLLWSELSFFLVPLRLWSCSHVFSPLHCTASLWGWIVVGQQVLPLVEESYGFWGFVACHLSHYWKEEQQDWCLESKFRSDHVCLAVGSGSQGLYIFSTQVYRKTSGYHNQWFSGSRDHQQQ